MDILLRTIVFIALVSFIISLIVALFNKKPKKVFRIPEYSIIFNKKRSKALRICKWSIFILIGGLVLIGIMFPKTPDRVEILDQNSAISSQSQASNLVIPDDQIAFIKAIDTAREEYKNAYNDLLKSRVRRQRARAICSALPSPVVKNWIGTIKRLTTTSEGQGVLVIQIAEGITLETSNNVFSDLSGPATLIDPDSKLFDILASLEKGQKIRFSGRLFRENAKDCYQEKSITLDGSMKQPQFLTSFDSINLFNN
ncbi:hypothetical protein [Bartonella sp. DGB1]|uniref:hypothetical protein n=1 Tax=Bartonella sp. DGB1 TaxID=3239807 RepID=UPI0035243ADE